MQLSEPHDGMTFRISTERWVSFLKKAEIYCMIEAQGCGLERPRPGRWVPEQGTWDVLCGKCQWGGPQGQSGPERRMPVRQRKAGTKAGVPYDELRQLWAETAVMPVRQLNWYNGRSSVRGAKTAVSWDGSGLKWLLADTPRRGRFFKMIWSTSSCLQVHPIRVSKNLTIIQQRTGRRHQNVKPS